MAAVRVRFAPSPTGMLHLGGARTALFNYLYAKTTGGAFILRIEDTDQDRFVPGSVRKIQESLQWLGLDFDEGPSVGGDHGPYMQSERLPIYRHFADQLVKSGWAYPCFCSEARLHTLFSESPMKAGYDRHCRALSQRHAQEKIRVGSPHTIRLKVPLTGSLELSDVVYGNVVIPNSGITDQILLKSNGSPTYHLASVVDDHCMEISHVLRGEEWLLSSAKHLLIYSALNWTPPTYAHLPLLMTSSGKKMSKRNDDICVDTYKERGFQPNSIVNYLALLGWGPSKSGVKKSGVQSAEVFNINELIAMFSLKEINRAPAVMNEGKLLWLNRHHFRETVQDRCGLEQLALQLKAEVCSLYNIAGDEDIVHLDHLKKILNMLKDRIPFIPKVAREASYFWVSPTLNREQLLSIDIKDVGGCLNSLKDSLESIDFTDMDAVSSINCIIKETAIKFVISYFQFMAVTRIALSGQEATPSLAQVISLMGKRTVLHRLDQAVKLLMN